MAGRLVGLQGEICQPLRHGLGERCCAPVARLWGVQHVLPVRLSHQAQAVQSDVLIELDVDEGNASALACFSGRVGVKDLHWISI
jgi:hypothetical protein